MQLWDPDQFCVLPRKGGCEGYRKKNNKDIISKYMADWEMGARVGKDKGAPSWPLLIGHTIIGGSIR